MDTDPDAARHAALSMAVQLRAMVSIDDPDVFRDHYDSRIAPRLARFRDAVGPDDDRDLVLSREIARIPRLAPYVRSGSHRDVVKALAYRCDHRAGIHEHAD